MFTGTQVRENKQISDVPDGGLIRGKPLVSCIIIFLNAELFIREAIESVFSQTYKSWELILVDDGSTDGSTSIALSYAEKFSDRVRYVEHQNHQNRGMSASRNLGVHHANGEYIAFLDADDVWLPQKLERQVEILEEHQEAALVFGPWQSWSSWQKDAEQSDWIQNLHVQTGGIIYPPTLVSLWLQHEEAIPGHCATLARRKIFQGIGGFEDDFRDMYEDAVWLTKVCLETPVYVEGSYWGRYRQHSEKSCEKVLNAGKMESARIIFLNWVKRYLLNNHIQAAEVYSALDKELWKYRHPSLWRLVVFFRHPQKGIKKLARWTGHQTLSQRTRNWLGVQRKRFRQWQMSRWVLYGGLHPLRRNFGLGHGQCIDRYYIEDFLARWAIDIRGCVLEVQENTYTRQFGGDRVTKSDVLHVTTENPQATIIADLTSAEHVASNIFDCIILTQTLLLIYDVRAAIRTCYRILKPGGVLLVTIPGISQVIPNKMAFQGDFWRFTTYSASRLFTEIFPEQCVMVQSYGNVLAATAFLHGLVREELPKALLDYHDRDYEITITVRAQKPLEEGL